MLVKRETRLSILPGRQKRYMANTNFNSELLMQTYMTTISGWHVLGLSWRLKGFFVATQDQNLFTRNFQANILHNGADPRCRLFNTSIETIDHLISGCTILAVMSVQKDTIVIDNTDPGKSAIIMILKHSTNGISMNRCLLWIPQKWPFFRTFLSQVTEQCKLTGQI